MHLALVRIQARLIVCQSGSLRNMLLRAADVHGLNYFGFAHFWAHTPAPEYSL